MHDEVILEGPEPHGAAAMQHVLSMASDPLGLGSHNPLKFRVEGGVGDTWLTSGKASALTAAGSNKTSQTGNPVPVAHPNTNAVVNRCAGGASQVAGGLASKTEGPFT